MARMSLSSFSNKLDWEGGLGGMIDYCGGKAGTDNPFFNEKWAQLYALWKDIEAMLPETE